MKRKFLKKTKGSLIVASVILCLYSLSMLMPLYFLLVNSFKQSFEFFDNAWALPESVYFENYALAWELGVGNVSILDMYVNSIIMTVATVLISTAATTVSAYVLARFSFRGRGFLRKGVPFPAGRALSRPFGGFITAVLAEKHSPAFLHNLTPPS